MALVEEVVNRGCCLYEKSYPVLVDEDVRLGEPAAHVFQFKSCSRAVTQDVLDHHIPAIDSSQQVVLLSVVKKKTSTPAATRTRQNSNASGNDIEPTNILNQCIFQWAVTNPTQVTAAKAAATANTKYSWISDVDRDRLGRDCEAQSARMKELIASSGFSNKLNSALRAAKTKLGPV
jgi:hypothetical protein